MDTSRAIASSRAGFEKFVAPDFSLGGSTMTRMVVRRTSPRRGHRPQTRSAPAPFDVPSEGSQTGFRRETDSLVAVLAVTPSDPIPIVVGQPHGAGQPILPAVIATMAARDVAPWSVDIVSHTMGWWSDGPATRAYRSLLGGVPIAAHRSVYLKVRIRPTDFPDAVARRGGDGPGALRTALWCVRRLRNRLSENGVLARPLNAAEIADLTASFADRSGVDGSSTYEWVGRDRDSLAALIAAPGTVDAASTSLTLQLVGGPAGPRLRGTVRDGGGPSAARSGNHDLRPVTDDDPGFLTPEQTASLTHVALPVAGDGQVIGADPSGAPVAFRLAGPNIPQAHVIGDDTLVRQVVVRLAALGVPVAIASDNPQRWERLAMAIGGGLVTIGQQRRPARVLLDDTAAGEVSALPGSTLLRRHADTSALTVPGPLLRQDRATGTVVVRGADRSATARLVSTAAERTLTEVD